MKSKIISAGHYLPRKVMTNHEMEALVETSHDWIVERTGIHQRHIASEDESTSSMATFAAREALAKAQLSAEDVDLVILATTTPDQTFPASAVEVQYQLGMRRGFAFDVQAVCSGFVYALSIADSMIRTGQVRTALVIGAECMSRIVDWTDRSTCVLFGDGAGAVVLQGVPDDSLSGILSCHLYSDGSFKKSLYVEGGTAYPTKQVGVIKMAGAEVFRHAVNKIGEAVMAALHHNNLTVDEIDWFIPHQANIRIINGIAEKFRLPKEKVIAMVDRHANTSAASVPLALSCAWSEGRLREGDLIIMEALGGGMTWGSVALRL